MNNLKQKSKSRYKQVKKKCFTLDMFSEQLPQFNLRGEQTKASWCGTLSSLILLTLMISYGSLKLETLLQRKNPTISFSEKISAFDESTVLDLKSAGLKFAFTAEKENGTTYELVNDSRYVRFMATVSGYTEGDWGLRPISFHECTEAELKEFAPPTHDSKL